MTKPKLIIIGGPTGVGKTEIAIDMARRFGGEIISADSMQVYRYMDIGTAKPTEEERHLVPHHVIDVVNPDEEYNAAAFLYDAARAIEDLERRNKKSFVVGGTGLYIRILLGGLFEGPGADLQLRCLLKEKMEHFGKRYLYDELKRIDTRAARKIHPDDTVRIIRALEVYEQTGESIVSHQEKHRFSDNAYEYLKIGLMADRKTLYDKIDRRCERMIVEGLCDEVKNLLKRGYDGTLKPMKTICYKHMISHVNREIELEQALQRIARDTRHYAKRQLTWFRNDEEIKWFHPDSRDDVAAAIEHFIA